MDDSDHNLNREDRAVRDRLRELGQRPVDTSGLEGRLASAMGRGDAPAGGSRRRWRLWAAAASLLLAAGVLWLALPAQAQTLTPADMISAHQHYRERCTGLTTVTDYAQARQVIRTRWADAPELPEVGDLKVEACCVYPFGRCRCACVHLRQNGKEVTLMVTHASRVRYEAAGAQPLAGTGFAVAREGNARIVTRQVGDRFVAVVSDLSEGEMSRVVASLRF